MTTDERAFLSAEVEALLIDWAWQVDHGAPEAMAELFAPDGVYVMPEYEQQGQAAIRAMCVARSQLKRIARHVTTNIRIGSATADRIEVTSLLTVYGHQGSDRTIPKSVFDCSDLVERTPDGRLKFRERRLVRIFAYSTAT